MLTAMAAAALGGYVLCGINDTRRGAALVKEIVRADCQILLAVLRSGATDTLMMIFTSGTSGEPKAVQVTHLTVNFAGANVIGRFEVESSGVCYLSMLLFHSNALLAGWSVAVGSGAAMVPATFSASRLLSDLRRYGATYMNYVGKPLAYVLATPEQPDDADNPLRVAFGNEASDRDIAEFSRRFDCKVWDGFGSTEGAITITREDGCPAGSLGQGFPGVSIYNADTLAECAVARFDADGTLMNPDKAIGELVNTTGAGLFAGYYNDRRWSWWTAPRWPRRSSASFWPPSRICRPKRGRATSGSPTSCLPPRPTKSSSASSAPRAPTRPAGCCGPGPVATPATHWSRARRNTRSARVSADGRAGMRRPRRAFMDIAAELA